MVKQGRESSGKKPEIHLLFLRVRVDTKPPTHCESRSQKIPVRDAGLGMGLVDPSVAEKGLSRAWAPHSHSQQYPGGLCSLCRHLGLSAVLPGNARAHRSQTVSLGAGQCLPTHLGAAGCFRVPELPAGPFLSLFWVTLCSYPGPGGSVGAVAHHRLGCRGVGYSGTNPGTKSSSSGRSFWRSCDLRQLCLLWVLPTSTPGLWVLSHPEHQHGLGGAKFGKIGLKIWKD